MASQMLASVKGISACTTPNEASASTTEASCGVSQQTRTCARTPIGCYLRVSVRHRLNRTADLDGEVDAEPGLKIPGAVHHCPGRVDRKSTRLNSSHVEISYAVFCLKKKKKKECSICFENKKNKQQIDT